MTNLTSSIQVSEEVIAAGAAAFQEAHEQRFPFEVRLRMAYLAMRSKDHSIAVDDGREVLQRAVETLAASRHLIGKYTPDHHWLPEHDQRIADLKTAITAIGRQSK